MPPFRLITFNIAHGRGLSLYQGFHSAKRIFKNLEKIADLLKATQVDVVALQEVDEASHWTKGINLMEYLQEKAGFPFAVMGVHNRRAHPKRPLAYGNALLSRFPILTTQTQAFGNAPLGEKGFLYAELDIHNTVVPLLNVHLDYRSRKRRLLQVEHLIQFLKDRPNHGTTQPLPPIICGDFNSRAQMKRDAVAHLMRYSANHSPYTLHPRGAGTFPAHLPTTLLSRIIDFVLLPTPYHALHCEVIKARLSDHRPVLIEIGS